MRSLGSILTAAFAAAVVGVAAGAGVALGIGFLLAAFYLYLLPYTGPPAAAAATGGLAFLVAIVVVGIFALVIRIARIRAAPRAPAHPRSSADAGAGTAGASAMMREAGGWIGDHPMAAGLGALSAGLVLGLNPELRRALADGVSAWLRASRPRDEGRRGPGDG